MDAEQRLARERTAESIVQQAMEGADAERPDPDPLLRQRRLELGSLASIQAPGEQHAHVLVPETPHGEGQRTRRGRIEPLDVVDGDYHRMVFAQRFQDVPNRHAEGSVVNRIIARLFDEQRHFEGAPAGCRESPHDLLGHVLEEIAETGMGEAVLGFGGTGGENAHSKLTGLADSSRPESRLPDAGLALQHERRRAASVHLDEGLDGGELLFPADNFGSHRPETMVTQSHAREKRLALAH